MRKIILPYQTYFVTTNIKDRQWVFASRSATDRMADALDCPAAERDPRLREKEKITIAQHVGGDPVPRRIHASAIYPNEQTCHILLDNLNFYRAKFSFLLHGFVFMSDHVHLLLTVGKNGTISDIMRDWKHRTGFEMNNLLYRQGCLWQRDFWEHTIRNEKDFLEKINYIHQNPVKSGYVDTAEEWKYSSARWYSGMVSCIEVDVIMGGR